MHQIIGQRAFEMDFLARYRMFEAEHGGVQRLTGEGIDNGAGFIRQFAGFGSEPAGISRIADQRMADMGHVDADLVGAAGFELAGQQRGNR